MFLICSHCGCNFDHKATNGFSVSGTTGPVRISCPLLKSIPISFTKPLDPQLSVISLIAVLGTCTCTCTIGGGAGIDGIEDSPLASTESNPFFWHSFR